MADWSKPTLTDLYTDVLDQLDLRLDDAATMFSQAPVNIPIGAIRYLRSGSKFQEWDGAAWIDIILAVPGGGTGADNPDDALDSLNLGTMSVQNANAVSITGGTLSSITSLGLSGTLSFTTDAVGSIGSNTSRCSTIYLRNGLVIPVGTDKFVTA